MIERIRGKRYISARVGINQTPITKVIEKKWKTGFSERVKNFKNLKISNSYVIPKNQ